jgi:hypothetical protein
VPTRDRPATPFVLLRFPDPDKENRPNLDATLNTSDVSAIHRLAEETQPSLQELDRIIAALAQNHDVPDDLRGLLERSFSQLANQLTVHQENMY